ncbi:ATP-grasp domain-containing protein [Streptomyces sp. NBC_00557]|uniref:ATP-grasp domain-containing protein n=1 Tax=Streptomyces sp. NBC_00557 TaxID=2975776 RepID=UPI002E812FB0|nr:ATP-grasp domain-containing protein [Streptomyces sp. NBC_00557]WUC40185.1 ATP-grasp domain-containing protein [Streptomyces sp. NBC_00557]
MHATGTPAARPAVLLVESRRATFTDHVLARDDVDVVLLRFDTVQLTEEYIARTAHVPTFTLNTSAPLEDEAARYLRWMKGTRGLPRPTHFCNPNEALQAAAQRFAALVDLPHLSEEQVGWVRNKMTMKDRYAELGIPHAAYRPVRALQDVVAFGDEHGWPVILKPVDSDSCIGTYRLDSAEDLAGVPPLDPDLDWMAEEYIKGREFQLCAVIARGVVLDAYLSKNPVPILEVLDGKINANITYAPGEEIPVDARALAQRLTDGLGIPYGYLHGEFFLTDDGEFVMSEVAARLSGCEVPMNHGLAYGFDFLHVILDTYLDRVPVPEYTLDRAVGDLLLPTAPGRVVHISSEEELLRLPGVIGARLTAAPGDVLDPPRASHASTGYVHVEGATADEVEERMHTVLRHFELKVDES